MRFSAPPWWEHQLERVLYVVYSSLWLMPAELPQNKPQAGDPGVRRFSFSWDVY